MKVLMSIKPQYAGKIMRGEKKYEYRRYGRQHINTIFMYETSPVKKVVAKLQVKKILVDSPDRLWESTKEYSGISKEEFMKYFKGCDIGYAYEVEVKEKYAPPKDIIDFCVKRAPQSYVYVDRRIEDGCS